MSKSLIARKFRSLMPYFLLALLIIIAYRVISELGFFAERARWLWGIVSPFFSGFVIAYILNIPCGGIARLLCRSNLPFVVKRAKGLSILLAFLFLILLVVLILNLIIPAILGSIDFFVANLDVYYQSILSMIAYLNTLEFFGFTFSADAVIESLHRTIASAVDNFNFSDIATPLHALMGFSSAVFRGFLAIISSIYILFEKDKCKQFLSRLLRAFTSPGVGAGVIKYAGRLNNNFKRYIYTQTIDGLILGTIVTVQLYLMGSPYFLLLGLTLGVVNYVPYFGSIVGTLVAVAVVAFTQGLGMGAIAAVVLLVTQQIDGNVIQPRLMGGSFSISPFLIIVSITLGGAIAGILGMIAAIPIVAVLKDVFENLVDYFEQKRFGKPGPEALPDSQPAPPPKAGGKTKDS